jgi:hypothetical protein
MKTLSFARFSACLLILIGLAGCTTYYRVTDQTSRRVYYTKDVDRTESGAVRFYDARSGSEVTLQSSEIVKVSRDAYEDGIRR